MAGKFLSLEEAARHLGVTVEDINRLIDRKKLFPMRDGATVKFKLEDIERVAAELHDESSGSGELSLELELSSPGIGGPAGG
ncbi:MAG: helix-turn-helix domain-containing protein, partial [Planctomycetia bacterium]|nr:helix-turn-helix domain-containing protein [Planctomycetia bacterium]